MNLQRKRNVIIIIIAFLMCSVNSVIAVETQVETKLEDGIYIIKSALNEKYVFNIEESSDKNGGNLELWSNSNNYYQRFMVKKSGSDTYTISAIYDNKYLDVSGSGKENGTNVEQWEYHGGSNQQWTVKAGENGYYNIISKCNGLYIDIPQSNAKNGANVQVWEKNNSKNQLFKFEKVEKVETGKKTIENGTYIIKTALNENYVFDIESSNKANGGNLQLWSNNKTSNQRYIVKYLNNGTYSISAEHSKKYLDVEASSMKIGTNVAQWKENGKENQQWIIKEAGNGYYNIISNCNGLYIDIPQSKAKNGANVQLWEKNNAKNQMFQFEKITVEEGTSKTIENGTYYIKCASNNKVLDVNGSSVENGGNVGFWTNGQTSNQKFNVKYLENGYYIIVAQHSDKSIKVSDKTNSVNVEQNNKNEYDNEQWVIKKTEDGYYNIISKINGNYLKQTTSGNAEVGKKDNTNNQKFSFEKPIPIKGSKTIENGTYIIKTEVNNNWVIDVPGSSIKNKQEVKIWDNASTANQKYEVTYIGDGYYTITAQHSGKAIEIADGSKKLYTKIEQNTKDNTDKQKWIIKEAGNGYYTIISKSSELCIGLEECENGTNLQMQNINNSNIQRFKFEKPIPLKGTQTIEDGTYIIASELARKLVFDIPQSSKKDGEQLEIWTNGLTENQKFNVKYIGNGYYTITAVHSGKVLEVAENDKKLNARVVQNQNKTEENQQWIIKEAGNGYYNIISRSSELCMNITNAKAENGTKIQTYTVNNTAEQRFEFLDPNALKIDIEIGSYGVSGLKQSGNGNGSDLKYYKYGSGPNVFFATFCVHGYEDHWNADGTELVKIADEFFEYLKNSYDYDLANKWTIYIFPEVNPDGRRYGWTNDGPGRTTLYSAEDNHKGIDINRCWSSNFLANYNNRNYTGSEPFLAYEARYLREFLLSHKSNNGQTLLVDLHGWTQQLIGDPDIRWYYKQQFPDNIDTPTYGKGYLIGWARDNLGSRSKVAKTALIELPKNIYSAQDVENNKLKNRYIEATINMLKNIN